MKRCLSILDVMFIAIGHMIGAGIYVLTGSVVRKQAGPAIILSFVFSGFAALMSAFSYAEFGASTKFEVLVFVIICGFTYADFSLWSGYYSDGRLKFFPYGLQGVISGSSTCFFAFIGFEALATAGEETKNPQRTIPLATFSSLGIICVLYVLMGASLTLMVPYDQIDVDAAFAAAFELKGANVAKIIMSIGALAGMLNNLVTGSFALPRAVYAMADDGLIFGWFGVINSRTKTPINATIAFTTLNAILALVFDLEALVDFMSIGTLLAYSTVSVCVIIVRYHPQLIDENGVEYDNGGSLKSWVPFSKFWQKFANDFSIRCAICGLLFGYVCLALPFKTNTVSSCEGIVLLIVGSLISMFSFIFIIGHEQNKSSSTYKVPFVPYLPCLGLLINVFMMIYLNFMTWVRLLVWLAIGIMIYLCYGIRHSKEAKTHGREVH
uniref:AA_permease_C domain-containing protein n=1 Tax=Caenorhabditis tropicalis TaxID=1561998 RepID=A0A1I7TFY6_9PELO